MRAVALNHATRRLCTAYLFSKTGEFAFEAAFAVAVVNLADANLFHIGIIYFLRYIPSLVFSPIGGWLADNFPKKYVLTSAELLKGLAALILFLIYGLHNSAVILMVLASMLMTAGDCLYTPTFRAYFPEIVENEQLPSLNSGIQAIEDGASIIGPLLFALISIFISPATTFLLFLFCLIISASWILTLSKHTKTQQQKLQGISIFKSVFHSAIVMSKSNKPLFTVICCTTVCALFATSILRFVLPAAVLEEFHNEAAVGYIYALLATGTVLGSILYERFNSVTSARSVVHYWFAYGLLFLLSALTLKFSVPLFVVTLLFVGLAGAFVDISIITNIQLLSRQHETGRNFSLYYFTAVLGDALSGLIASFMFLIAGPATLVGMTFFLSIAPLGWNKRPDEDKEQ